MNNVEENNNDNYEKFLDNNLSRIYTIAEIFLDTIRYVPDGLISIGHYVFPINDIIIPIRITNNSILITTESSNVLSPKNFIFKDYNSVIMVVNILAKFILQVKELLDLSFKYEDETIYYKDILDCNSDFMNSLFLDIYCGKGKTKKICIQLHTTTLKSQFNNIISRFRYINHGGICIEEMENHFRFIKESINEIEQILLK